MPPVYRVCYVCGAGFPDLPGRNAHMAAEHAGYRIEWVERDPVVVDPEGSRRPIGKAEQQRLRRGAKSAQAPKAPARSSTRPKRARSIESIAAGGPSDGNVPASDDGPAAIGPRPSVIQPTVRITPEQRMSSVREDLAETFTVDMLATIVLDLSKMVSEFDGAGEDGYLSRIQSVQVASLLYDSTLDMIVSRFRGDVGKFKMALAVVVMIAAKGRVHAKAIAAKVTPRRRTAPVSVTPEAPAEPVVVAPAPPVAREDAITAPVAPVVTGDAIAELRERQRASRAGVVAESRRQVGGDA